MQDDVLGEEGRTQVVAIIPVQPCILGTALGLGCHCEDYSWRLPASVRWDLVGDPCGVSPARARNSAIKKEFSERSPIYSDLGGPALCQQTSFCKRQRWTSPPASGQGDLNRSSYRRMPTPAQPRRVALVRLFSWCEKSAREFVYCHCP